MTEGSLCQCFWNFALNTSVALFLHWKTEAVMLPYSTEDLVGGYIRINMGSYGVNSFQYDTACLQEGVLQAKRTCLYILELCFIAFCTTSPQGQCWYIVSARITWTELLLLLKRGGNLHYFVLQSEWGSHCEGLESLFGGNGWEAQLSPSSGYKSDSNFCMRNSFEGVHFPVSPPFLHWTLS